MEFFKALEHLLQITKPEEKINQFYTFYQAYHDRKLTFNHSTTPLRFKEPSFKDICNIVDAKTMPKRTALSTKKGKAYLIHAIAHIEYSAIDLALDHAYRFRNMPKKFYDDWLEVAEDEIRHFLLCQKLLEKYGYSYGAFDVHAFLFDVSMRSLDLVTRMAVIPRHLEASGLDANPQMIAKLSHHKDDFANEAIKALETILKEEVSHVQKGDYWFKWACQEAGIDPKHYFDIVEEVLPGAKKKKPFINIKARQKAGFSCIELRQISDENCQD
jgi:uncharacterized ferritin-like protein (DUF455 family)